MRHSTIPTRLTMLLMLAGAAPAQSGGAAMALPQGFSVDNAIGPYSSGSVILNDTDFDATLPPMQWAPPGTPDFNMLSFTFAGCDVDALSLGLDWVSSDFNGVVSVPNNNWALLTYSVRPSTVGLPSSLIESEVGLPGGAASDIFGYVLPGSSLPALVGVPFRVQDSTEIATPPGSNIDAHDVFIGLLYRDNPQIAAMLPPPTVYFSVTDATKGLIPVGTGLTDWTTNPALASGATVFETTWLGTSWRTPRVYLAPAEMGLEPTEDLDGLALDVANFRVLLSTDRAFPPAFPTPPRDQLLYSNLRSSSNTTYTLLGGGPVSTAIGLGGADDADGICMLDPTAVLYSQPVDRMIGTPQAALPLPGMPASLQMSLTRFGPQGTNQEFFRTFMTGWPQLYPMQPGFAVVAVTIGPPSPFSSWWSLGLLLRPDPVSQYFAFEGHPERYDWPIPNVPNLNGTALTFLWGAISNAGFVALSHPATIKL